MPKDGSCWRRWPISEVSDIRSLAEICCKSTQYPTASLSRRSSQSEFVVIQAGILDEAVKVVRSEVHHGCQLLELGTGDLLAAICLEGEPEVAMVEFVPDD
jgi:hypothetical protein